MKSMSTRPIEEAAAHDAAALEHYTFTVPPQIVKEGTNYATIEGKRRHVEKISLVLLTTGQERAIASRCADDRGRMAYEFAKESISRVNGEAVSSIDGAADQWWDGFHPHMRQLVMTAYTDINDLPKDSGKDFLASRVVET